MLEDSQKAIDINPSSFKAFLRLGEAQVEIGKQPTNLWDISLIDKGIKNMQKAAYLCWKLDSTDKNFNNKDELQIQIGKQVLKARKIKWYK